jgi:hypothetical protein
MNRKDIFEMMKNLGEADFDAFPNLSPFEGAEIIHSYSRAEAIEDGVLIDVSKQAAEVGITLHTAVTPAVWAELIGNPKWEAWGTEDQRLKRLLSDACSELEKRASDIAFFCIRMADLGVMVGEIHIRAQRGPGDNLEPVLTVMLGHED